MHIGACLSVSACSVRRRLFVLFASQRIVTTLEALVAKMLKFAFAVRALPLVETKTNLGAIRS